MGSNMNAPKLVPRKYLIEQDINEYFYFVEFAHNKKWVISLGVTNMCLCESGAFDYFGDDTRQFDTPEEALKNWMDYAAIRFPSRTS